MEPLLDTLLRTIGRVKSKMVRKYRYRDRESGIDFFDFKPSKMEPLLDRQEHSC